MEIFANPYYESTAGVPPESFPPLNTDIECDVVVVGAGFAGLSSAIHLAKSGFNVVLLERYKVGGGASGCNGGHMAPLESHGPNAMEKTMGKSIAPTMWGLSVEAGELVNELIAEYNINCDAAPGMIRGAVTEHDVNALREEVLRYKNEYNHSAIELLDHSEISDLLGTEVYKGGTYDKSVIRIHPLKFAYGLARAAKAAGVKIHEGSEVISYDTKSGVTVKTSKGQVKARKAVFACCAYLRFFEKRIDKHVIDFQSHICVTEPLGAERAKALNRKDVCVMDMFPAPNYYHLTEGDRLFFGGEGLISETDPEKIKQTLKECMLRVYPQLEDVQIAFGWTGKAVLTPNFLPHLGKLGADVYYSQVPGLVWSLMGGKLIAEDARGMSERFDTVAALKIPAIPGGHAARTQMGKLMKLKMQHETKNMRL